GVGSPCHRPVRRGLFSPPTRLPIPSPSGDRSSYRSRSLSFEFFEEVRHLIFLGCRAMVPWRPFHERDALPLHRMCYYHSRPFLYHLGVLERLHELEIIVSVDLDHI